MHSSARSTYNRAVKGRLRAYNISSLPAATTLVLRHDVYVVDSRELLERLDVPGSEQSDGGQAQVASAREHAHGRQVGRARVVHEARRAAVRRRVHAQLRLLRALLHDQWW